MTPDVTFNLYIGGDQSRTGGDLPEAQRTPSTAVEGDQDAGASPPDIEGPSEAGTSGEVDGGGAPGGGPEARTPTGAPSGASVPAAAAEDNGGAAPSVEAEAEE